MAMRLWRRDILNRHDDVARSTHTLSAPVSCSEGDIYNIAVIEGTLEMLIQRTSYVRRSPSNVFTF